MAKTYTPSKELGYCLDDIFDLDSLDPGEDKDEK